MIRQARDFFTGRTGVREVETEARIWGFGTCGFFRQLRNRRSAFHGSNNKNLPFLPSSRPPCEKIWGLPAAGQVREVTP
jgi:hypothetical protein